MILPPPAPYIIGGDIDKFAVDRMDENFKAQLDARARHKLTDGVHYNATVYRVIARYWRRSNDKIYYDLREMVPPGRQPRYQYKVLEQFVHKPSLHTLGLRMN
ncbi:MAG: hypothetical protein IPG74_02185 [Flavobacteriales bacterium]|nr:hypothetical protein [Flavobacteriales bacterium]